MKIVENTNLTLVIHFWPNQLEQNFAILALFWTDTIEIFEMGLYSFKIDLKKQNFPNDYDTLNWKEPNSGEILIWLQYP